MNTFLPYTTCQPNANLSIRMSYALRASACLNACARILIREAGKQVVHFGARDGAERRAG